MNRLLTKTKRIFFYTLCYNERYIFLNRAFTFFISSLILANICIVLASSFEDLLVTYQHIFVSIESVSVVIFTVEYLLRFFVADMLYPGRSKLGAMFKFAKSPLGLIDFIAIVPFYLPIISESYNLDIDLLFMRSLRMLAILRFLTFSKHGISVKVLLEVIKDLRFELTAALFIISILITLSATLLFTFEKDAQPDKFRNIGDAFWWAVVTLSTVGYGDLTPITTLGKFFGGILSLFGVGIFVIPATLIGAAFVHKIQYYKDQQKIGHKNPDYVSGPGEKHFYCPHCGKKL